METKDSPHMNSNNSPSDSSLSDMEDSPPIRSPQPTPPLENPQSKSIVAAEKVSRPNPPFRSPVNPNPNPVRNPNPSSNPSPVLNPNPNRTLTVYAKENSPPPVYARENSPPPVYARENSPPPVYAREVLFSHLAVEVTAGTKVEDGGGDNQKSTAVRGILRRSRRDVTLKRASLGFRICEVLVCLISFSVMSADKTQGWAGDSFDRYKEYRYCLSMTVIAFVYSGFQAFDLAYSLITGKHVIRHHLCYHFEFVMDQILAYLLISASSSAATRADDWQSNWGKDEFTEMATASISMSFLAFAAFAMSSLISGYNLCMHNSA